MNRVVIVPGFTNGKTHYMRLWNELTNQGIRVQLVYPWQTQTLLQLQNQAVFVGHSLGAYVIEKLDLQPAVVVGLPHPKRLIRHFWRYFQSTLYDAFRRGDILFHLRIRLLDVINGFRYALPLTRLSIDFFRKPPLLDNIEQVLIIRNESDLVSVTDMVHYRVPGHHDDIIYNPTPYIPYIKRLLENH